MKSVYILLMILFAASVSGAVHENVVFYKDQGGWICSIPAIPAGQSNAGRIAWDGKTPLILTPRKNGFELTKANYLSWMMYLKPDQIKVRYDVILTFSDGQKRNLRMTTHKRPGWNRCIPFDHQMEKLSQGIFSRLSLSALSISDTSFSTSPFTTVIPYPLNGISEGLPVTVV